MASPVELDDINVGVKRNPSTVAVPPPFTPKRAAKFIKSETEKQLGTYRKILAAGIVVSGALLCVVIAISWTLAANLQQCSTFAEADRQLIIDAIHSPFHPNSWIQIFPVGIEPAPRVHHTACAAGGTQMYVHGGLYGSAAWSINYSTLDDLWVYTENQNSWAELSQYGSLPSARFQHTLVNGGSALVLFGGFNVHPSMSGHTSLGDMFTFDLVTSTWSRVTYGGSSPVARGGHSAVWYDSHMYIFGGASSLAGQQASFQDLWKFSFGSMTWVSLSPTAEGRSRALLFVSSSGLLVLTGGTCNGICGTDFFYVFSNGTWQQRTSNRSPRTDSAAAVAPGGVAFEFGGLYPAAGQQTSNDLFAFDTQNFRWMQLFPNFIRGTAPPPTSGHVFVQIGERAVLFGGSVDSIDSPGTNQIWEYSEVLPV